MFALFGCVLMNRVRMAALLNHEVIPMSQNHGTRLVGELHSDFAIFDCMSIEFAGTRSHLWAQSFSTPTILFAFIFRELESIM